MTNWYKEERRRLKELRRKQKLSKDPIIITEEHTNIIDTDNRNKNVAFVLGNGTSRRPINPKDLKQYGIIYGCNALYRSFSPDYLVAVDSKMIFEIVKERYQLENPVWTNPNKSYEKLTGFNFFNPSKGWSSGPTALHLASTHVYTHIYILGFDYKGLNDGKTVNNMYASSLNYKKDGERATFFGNWLKQTMNVVKENPQINYTRVIFQDGLIPKELVNMKNLTHITVEEFQKIFDLK